MTDSYISTSAGGTSFVGKDAVHFYRALTLRNAISLHQKCGMIPTRGMGIVKMFTLAGEYTGQKYKRGEHARALDDLTVWIETMRSALPVESNDARP
jgi:hypothetical protein